MSWDGVSYAPHVNQDDPALQLFVEDLIVLKSLLKEQGRKYFALSTISFHDGEYRVWLNPHPNEQSIYNYGVYTINELLMWLDDDGPVMRKK